MNTRNFEDRGIKGSKIRLSNNSWFVASSFDNKRDVPVFKVDENDQIVFNEIPFVKGLGPLLLDNASNNFYSEKISITEDNVLSKSLTLTNTPANPDTILFFPKGGLPQFIGDDFTLNGKDIEWNGLGLDGLLADGDLIMLFYQI